MTTNLSIENELLNTALEVGGRFLSYAFLGSPCLNPV